MLKTSVRSGVVSGLLSMAIFLVPNARGQAMPTATGRGGGLQVGAGVTYGKPDFGEDWIGGATGFADYNFSAHLGVEGDVHYLTLHTPEDLGEETYEAGPRAYWRKSRYTLYGKGLIGYGKFVVQELQDNPGKFDASSFMYSLGGGLDIDFRHRITVRAFDFEYQNWPGFANNGLTPVIGTVGVAYRFR